MDMELYVLTFKSTSCIVFLFLLSMQVILLLFIYKCINEFSIKVSVLELYVLGSLKVFGISNFSFLDYFWC